MKFLQVYQTYHQTTWCSRRRSLSKSCSPRGFTRITSLPYKDRVAAVEVAVERVRGPLAGEVSALPMGMHVDRVNDLLSQFRDALT